MDLNRYYERRQQLLETAPQYRLLCTICLQPSFGCYCEFVQKIETSIKFVILIHPIEVKRRIATGRMAHLCLKNSELIMGQDYTYNERVNEIIQDPSFQPLILYPGKSAFNLNKIDNFKRSTLFPAGKKPVLFVIDGTWATAKKTMSQSQNLRNLTQVCFTPQMPSTFRVRKQPAPECYSTIEAIHYTLELLNTHTVQTGQNQAHDHLLVVFHKMVERQLEFIRKSQDSPNPRAYRRPQRQMGI